MNDPVFWQLGFLVVQEALVMAILCTAGYYLLRGLFHGLDRVSRAARAPAHIPPLAPAGVVPQTPPASVEVVAE